MSAEEGSILDYEAELVKNVLQLDQIRAREIMTPRPVVLKLPDNLTLKETFEKVKEWTYSRIPLYSVDDPETWTGFVLSSDILAEVARDQFAKTLGSLAKPLFFVSEDVRGHVLLKSFLKRQTHLFGVMDEYGDLIGIVTLEDVLESVIGEEIVDEVDTVADMQEVARRRKREQLGLQNRRLQQNEPPDDPEKTGGVTTDPQVDAEPANGNESTT
jgi:CBS domain containing-hemolysin-like protein